MFEADEKSMHDRPNTLLRVALGVWLFIVFSLAIAIATGG